MAAGRAGPSTPVMAPSERRRLLRGRSHQSELSRSPNSRVCGCFWFFLRSNSPPSLREAIQTSGCPLPAAPGLPSPPGSPRLPAEVLLLNLSEKPLLPALLGGENPRGWSPWRAAGAGGLAEHPHTRGRELDSTLP